SWSWSPTAAPASRPTGSRTSSSPSSTTRARGAPTRAPGSGSRSASASPTCRASNSRSRARSAAAPPPPCAFPRRGPRLRRDGARRGRDKLRLAPRRRTSRALGEHRGGDEEDRAHLGLGHLELLRRVRLGEHHLAAAQADIALDEGAAVGLDEHAELPRPRAA